MEEFSAGFEFKFRYTAWGAAKYANGVYSRGHQIYGEMVAKIGLALGGVLVLFCAVFSIEYLNQRTLV